MHCLLCRLCLLPWLLFALPAWAGGLAVVLSDTSPPYQEFASTIQAELRDGRDPPLTTLDVDQLAQRTLNDFQIIVGVGGRAAQALALQQLKVPVLLTLLPKSAFERLIWREPRNASAIFLDQPPGRYLDLIRTALPEVVRVGFLRGNDSAETVSRLTNVAREKRLRPVHEDVVQGTHVFPALQRMFGDGHGGVLLATPDPAVYNSQTLPGILLTTYRYRVPVVGFSPAYIKAGALLALYTTPAQFATQTAQVLRTALAQGTLPAAQYPRQFSVGVNRHVARSLELNLEPEPVLRDRLMQLEQPGGAP